MINHVFVAYLEKANNNDFVERSLTHLQQAMLAQESSRILQVLDGFSFPWHNHISIEKNIVQQGLLRFATETQINTEGFETVVAFDAPLSETKQVNELAANWLIAYADSMTIVWDGNENSSEGMFVRILLDKAINARLTITLILPQTEQILLLTGDAVTDLDRSRLSLGLISIEILKSWFTPWTDVAWKRGIQELSSALAGIKGENSNKKGHSWLASIKKTLFHNPTQVHYRERLSWWERMAGYTERLMFASIALDGDYWKKMKFIKPVSSDDGTHYGPFEGVYQLNNNAQSNHSIIQATNHVDHEFKKHDQNASLAANRQRSTYWWVAIFNLGAVLLSLFGVGLEWVLVLMGMGLARIAIQLRWSDRWINSRSLAETLRYSRMLMPLLAACQYQRQPLWHKNVDNKEPQWSVGSPNDWLVRATIRNQGWPKPAISDEIIYSPLDKLYDISCYMIKSIEDQINYHKNNHTRQKRMVRHVGLLALTLGGIVTLLSLSQSFDKLSSADINNIVTFLPVLIGMFQGILAQIESKRLSEQSEATMHYLNNKLAMIISLQPDILKADSLQKTDRWSYFILLRTIATDSAEAMIRENQGWKSLLSSK